MPTSYSALIESGSRVLLALDLFPSPLLYLSKSIRDTWFVANANYPNYQASFPLAFVDPAEYPGWTWDPHERLFIKTPQDLLTDVARKRSRLAVAKADYLGKMMQNLSMRRSIVGTGVAFQETVYLIKRQQAERFAEGGYREESAHRYPFVAQYATAAHIPLKQAADDILFAARMDDEMLLGTESLRIIYFRRIVETDDDAALPGIYDEFVREMYGDGLAA